MTRTTMYAAFHLAGKSFRGWVHPEHAHAGRWSNHSHQLIQPLEMALDTLCGVSYRVQSYNPAAADQLPNSLRTSPRR
jgi:hypothetical protein